MQRRAPGIHQPHRITDDVLSLIAHRLDLARLAPQRERPLRAFLTQARH
jgi:hypothetical protein